MTGVQLMSLLKRKLQLKKMIYWTNVETAKGEYILLATEKGLCWVGTPGTPLEKGVKWTKRHLGIEEVVKDGELPLLKQAASELRKYLNRELRQFSTPVDLRGTSFQVAVWRQLIRILFGETCSYKDIAKAIGRSKAVRAVGAACGANPIAIIVPCHRVIARDGSLTGYGGGLSTKKWLLSLERVQL